MGHIRGKIEERHAEKRKPDAPKPPPFATGQSTQMLVGADESTDAVILKRADLLYGTYRLRRVYYSGFSPIPEPSSLLPIKPPPLVREHRLYPGIAQRQQGPPQDSVHKKNMCLARSSDAAGQPLRPGHGLSHGASLPLLSGSSLPSSARADKRAGGTLCRDISSRSPRSLAYGRHQP
jgi:hypothetical protein